MPAVEERPATSGVKVPSKPTEAQVKEQSVVRGGEAIMFTEKGGNDALTIGQAVNTTFGRGVLLDTGSSEHKCLSIKMKWGVIYAVSPSSIGIHVQSNGGHEDVVSMDIDEEEDEGDLSNDEDNSPKDTHYGTILESQLSVDVSAWTPKEKSLFEVAMWECDKDFTEAARIVGTKTFADCAKYYYCSWKLARSHRRWKQVRLFSSEIAEILIINPHPNS